MEIDNRINWLISSVFKLKSFDIQEQTFRHKFFISQLHEVLVVLKDQAPSDKEINLVIQWNQYESVWCELSQVAKLLCVLSICSKIPYTANLQDELGDNKYVSSLLGNYTEALKQL